MIKFNKNVFEFYTFIVSFTESGERISKFSDDKNHWNEMVKNWARLSDLIVTPLSPTPEQVARLDELNAQPNLSDNFTREAADFVEHGIVTATEGVADCSMLDALEIGYRDITTAHFAKILRDEEKMNRDFLVSEISVTTAAGNSFDGDELSQDRMTRAVTIMNDADLIFWTLSDNTTKEVNRTELVEALRLAGAAQSSIWDLSNV